MNEQTEGQERGRSGPEESSDGVDLTLIRWMLSLTPRERLDHLLRTLAAIRKLQDAAAGR